MVRAAFGIDEGDKEGAFKIRAVTIPVLPCARQRKVAISCVVPCVD